ncbi:MAG: O-antigen ligase family protein [Candidatus Hydrogenedentes bacterium]|nr:O-antigen ligase family protein [Candidatus Hydrogenedentota bacterium]
MSRKQSARNSTPRNTQPSGVSNPEAVRSWPADFPRPRVLYSALGALAAFAAAAFFLLLLKFYFPGSALLARVDVAALVVAASLALIAGLGMTHPSFGLAMLAFLRHWLDGQTYPGDEAYFTCATLFLFVLWGVRVLMRGGRIQHAGPALLLGAFLVAGAFTALTTYQFDNTYHRILQWSSFLALFMLATSALRSRAAVAVVAAGFAAGELCHAVYAVMQYEFVFDYTRQEMLKDPRILYRIFGVTEPTPELLRRLNINRAFGTMLFPNALGAFLILGIPLSIGAAMHGVLRHNETACAQTGKVSRAAAFRLALLVLITSMAVSFYITALYVMLAHIERDVPFLFALAFAAAVLVGVAHGAIAYRYAVSRGVWPAGYAFTAYFFLFLVVVQCIALWLTFSRGAMLSLALASAAAAAILWAARRGPRAPAPAARTAAAALLALCCGAVALNFGQARAQDAAPAPVAATANTGEVAAAPTPEMPEVNRQLLEEGASVRMQDLLDPSSFALRATYWKVGLRMAADNPLLGVGWGNFGVAYPQYQTVDAGDVQTAHNDYLQALCETGIFGFLAFTGFWAYFAVWGAVRIVREHRRADRWLLAGLYAGVLAFLIHSLVDFNFYNTSLVFYVCLIAALFYARAQTAEAGTETASGGRHTAHQIIVLALLTGAALIAGMSLRVYRQNHAISGNWVNVASLDRLQDRFDVGRTCLRGVFDYGMDQELARRNSAQPTKRVPGVRLVDVLTFFQPGLSQDAELNELRQTLERIGTLAAPTAAGGWRRLEPGDPLTRETWIWFNRKPWAALEVAMDAAEAWIRELEALDRMFPHRPDFAAHILDWYDMLLDVTEGGSQQDRFQRCLAGYLQWAEKAVARSPLRSEFRTRYGAGLWKKGRSTPVESRMTYFEQAIEQYRWAQRLRPEASSQANWDLRGALKGYGELLIENGSKEKGERYLEESETYREKALAVYEERIRLGLPF